MPELELSLLGLLLVALIVGSWSISWARADGAENRVRWGRRLFVATLLILGGCSMLAAFHRAETLVPLGLAAGVLLVGMLWEGPVNVRWDP